MRTLPLPLLAASLLLASASAVDAPAPAIDAGPDLRVECSAPGGAWVALDASRSSPPEQWGAVAYEWREGETLLATGRTASAWLGLGSHALMLRLVNGATVWAVDELRVDVVDTTAPTLAVAATVASSPHHELVGVHVDVQVSDACDAAPRFVLVSVASDEPDDGAGDGSTTQDVQGAEPGTPDVDLLLRAERSGGGDGRAYTLTYRAWDAAGNAREASGVALVAHGSGDARAAPPASDPAVEPDEHGRRLGHAREEGAAPGREAGPAAPSRRP